MNDIRVKKIPSYQVMKEIEALIQPFRLAVPPCSREKARAHGEDGL